MIKANFILLAFTLLIFNEITAQLSLNGTNWKGDRILSFSSDSLIIHDRSGNLTGKFFFRQDHDTVRVGLISYKSHYTHNGQLLSFSAIKRIRSRANIVFDAKVVYEYVPEDGSAFRDWSRRNPVTDTIAGIDLYRAYALIKGRKSKQVIVAVIDNGIDIYHEDLKDVIWTNTQEIPGNGMDDDHNGYIDDVHGWNFRASKTGTTAWNEWAGATQVYVAWQQQFENKDSSQFSGTERADFLLFQQAKQEYIQKQKESTDSFELHFGYNLLYNSSDIIGDDPADPTERNYGSPVDRLSPGLSHGTHVAGVIGAKHRNNRGVEGIADNVLIMPVVASAGGGDERDKDVANAIRYAVDNGARIINISFTKHWSPYRDVVDKAIQYAEQKQVLIVHCSGNYHENVDSTNYYPVATDKNGRKAINFINVGWSRNLFNYRLAHPNSDYGKMNVDIFAPGSDIFSTVPGNQYDFKSGSSMSAPMVTGVAALLLSYFPSLSTTQVKQIILQSAFHPEIMVNRPGSKEKVAFASLSATGGILNAYNAVELAIKMTNPN